MTFVARFDSFHFTPPYKGVTRNPRVDKRPALAGPEGSP